MSEQLRHPNNEPEDDDVRFNELLDEIASKIDNGEVVDRETLIFEYPEFEDRLLQFFDAYDVGESEIRPIVRSDEPPDIDPSLKYLGRYEILDLIDKGGMNAVYRARDLELNRDVALKILSTSYHGAGAKEILRNEATKLADLEDVPNIVEILDFGCLEAKNDLAYFAMRLVPGQSLQNILDCNGSKSVIDQVGGVRNLVAIFVRVCKAVGSAHRVGIIHGDIKPGNIILEPINESTKKTGAGSRGYYPLENGTGEKNDSEIESDSDKQNSPSTQTEFDPVLLDFGLSRYEESQTGLTRPGKGTPGYIAPEQMQGRPSSIVGDVFSIGATLLFALTGDKPRQTDNNSDPTFEHEVAVSLDAIDEHVDIDLEQIVMKSTRMDIERRYSDTNAFRTDLENWLEGLPVSARPRTRFERSMDWCRRNNVVLTIFAITLVGMIVILRFANWASIERSIALEQKEIADFQVANQQLLRTQQFVYEDRSKAKSMLEDVALIPAEKRDICWSILYRLANIELPRIEGLNRVRGFDLSENSEELALFDEDGQISVYATSPFKRKYLKQTHNKKLKGIEIHSSKLVAAFDGEGNVYVWDFQTDRQRLALDLKPGYAVAVGFSQNGSTMAVCDKNRTLVYQTKDFSNPTELKDAGFSLHVNKFGDAIYLIDSYLKHPEKDGLVRLWDVKSKSCFKKIPIPWQRVTPSDLGDENRRFLVTADDNGSVRVWDNYKNKVVRRFQLIPGTRATDLKVNNSRTMIAASVYQSRGGFAGGTAGIPPVSDDSGTLGPGRLSDGIIVWNYQTGDRIAFIRGSFEGIEFSNRLLVGLENRKLRRWRLTPFLEQSFKPTQGSSLNIPKFLIRPNNDSILFFPRHFSRSGFKELGLDEDGFSQQLSHEMDPFLVGPSTVSRNGLFATSCRVKKTEIVEGRGENDGSPRIGIELIEFNGTKRNEVSKPTAEELLDASLVTIWDSSDLSKSRVIDSIDGEVMGLAMAPSGKYLAISGSDKIQIWNIDKKQHKLMQEISVGSHYNMQFSRTGNEFLWRSLNGQTIIWDLTKKTIRWTNDGKPLIGSRVIFGPEPNTVVWIQAPSKLVFWDFVEDKIARSLETDHGGLATFAISPDGKTIATAGGKEYPSVSRTKQVTIALWDARTLTQRLVLNTRSRARIEELTFSADGKYLVSTDEFGYLRFWGGYTGMPYRSDNELHADF